MTSQTRIAEAAQLVPQIRGSNWTGLNSVLWLRHAIDGVNCSKVADASPSIQGVISNGRAMTGVAA